MSSTSSPSSQKHFRSSFLRTLNERGYISQCTDFVGRDEALNGGITPAYIGFDATADSLHVGHLLPIMTLRWLQRCGHKPIVLVGGGTTRIGDPSFRTESRPLLWEEQIAQNVTGIRRVFDRFLKFGDGPTDAVLVNNAEWLDELRYIPMLRDIGRYFSVNRMLSFESVKSRLERNESLSFLEFNYMILQAYDFLELSRRTGCRLQMGGSDQWGNIVNGIELVRRIDEKEVFGLTSPLLTTSSGAKMGKTAAQAVWLNAARLAPYDYWQFWRNTEDGDVGRFLRLFTDLPMDEVVRLEMLTGADVNAAKVVLANEVTTLAHGTDAAKEAYETARKTFESGGIDEGLPTCCVTSAELEKGLPLPNLLVRAGLCSSKGEARRLIHGGGARLNGVAITGEDARVNLPSFLGKNAIRLSGGTKATRYCGAGRLEEGEVGEAIKRSLYTGRLIPLSLPNVGEVADLELSHSFSTPLIQSELL